MSLRMLWFLMSFYKLLLLHFKAWCNGLKSGKCIVENILAEIPGSLKSMGAFTLVLCHTLVISPPSFFSLMLILWYSSIHVAMLEFVKILHVSLHNQKPSLHQTTEHYFYLQEQKLCIFPHNCCLIDIWWIRVRGDVASFKKMDCISVAPFFVHVTCNMWPSVGYGLKVTVCCKLNTRT